MLKDDIDLIAGSFDKQILRDVQARHLESFLATGDRSYLARAEEIRDYLYPVPPTAPVIKKGGAPRNWWSSLIFILYLTIFFVSMYGADVQKHYLFIVTALAIWLLAFADRKNSGFMKRYS